MGQNNLNYVIAKDIELHFRKMCIQIDLIRYLDSDLKVPKELLDLLDSYESIRRRLQYQSKKWIGGMK